jgi:hypothetical protein
MAQHSPVIGIHLGTEVLRLRPRGPIQWLAAWGPGLLGTEFGRYVLVPLVILPLFSLMGAAIVGAFFEDGTVGKLIGGISAAVLCYALGVWFFYIRPRSDYFVLCTEGFTFQMGGDDAVEVLFQQLRSIRLGANSTGTDALIVASRWLGKGGLGEMLDKEASSCMHLKYTNGARRACQYLLARFHPDDTMRFLEYVGQHHAALLAADGD